MSSLNLKGNAELVLLAAQAGALFRRIRRNLPKFTVIFRMASIRTLTHSFPVNRQSVAKQYAAGESYCCVWVAAKGGGVA